MEPKKTIPAFDTPYTSTNGKVSKLGDLPLPYLRNIKNKMERNAPAHEGENYLHRDICAVIEVKEAEADKAAAEHNAAIGIYPVEGC